MEIRKKIKINWDKYSLWNFLKKAIPFLFSYIPISFYCISEIPKNKIQSKCPIDIRKGTIDDIQLIIDLMKDDDPEEVSGQIRYLFDHDGELFLAFSENKLVHAATLHLFPGVLKNNKYERSPRINIEIDEVFIGHCETCKDYRGMNIYPVVLQHIIKYSFESGKKRCFISTAPWGIASIKGIEKAGFSLVGQKRRFRIFGKVFGSPWH